MIYKAPKFYYEIDEITSMKLKSLIGKKSFFAKDIQKILTKIIASTYERQNGKPFK